MIKKETLRKRRNVWELIEPKKKNEKERNERKKSPYSINNL